MTKHSKLYDKSPKLERNEDGDVAVKKSGAGPGEDGSSAEMDKDPHEEERSSMHKRHQEEQKAMHDRHAKDMKEMHKRHSGSKDKTGDSLINKTEEDSKE